MSVTPWCHPDNDGFARFKFCRFCEESDHLFPDEDDRCFNLEFSHCLLTHWIARFPEELQPWNGNIGAWYRGLREWESELEDARHLAWADLRA